jgi:hypothetical protein
VWQGLTDDDKWQSGHSTGNNLAELEFWLGEEEAALAQAAQASQSAATQTQTHVVNTSPAQMAGQHHPRKLLRIVRRWSKRRGLRNRSTRQPSCREHEPL